MSEKWISQKENLKKCTSFDEQKCARYIQKNVYFNIIIFICLSSTKSCLRFLLNCFFWETKGFHQSSLGNEVDFRAIMNLSPNILAKNQNFKNLRHGFLDERTLMPTTIISSCHWKTFVPFRLQKERSENPFLKLIVNSCKILQKNKLCHSKQQ